MTNEAVWGKLVTGHTTVTIGVVYRCSNITKQNNEKIHNSISEVSKGECIIMGDFNRGNITWDIRQSRGVKDQQFLCLLQDNFLTQHVLEPTRAARVLAIVLTSSYYNSGNRCRGFVDSFHFQENRLHDSLQTRPMCCHEPDDVPFIFECVRMLSIPN